MPEDRLSQLTKGYAEEDCLGLEPPDLGPLRALAEREELADAAGWLADAYGRSLPADEPLAPLARDIARALTEAGFTLHHCAQSHPLYRLGGVCLVPVSRGHDPDGRGGVVVSWTTHDPRPTICCPRTGTGGGSTRRRASWTARCPRCSMRSGSRSRRSAWAARGS